MHPIQVVDIEDATTMISFNEFFEHFKNKFVFEVNTPQVVHEMENYLISSLQSMYPKLNISLKITITSDNSIYVQFYNDFYKELKIYYPEVMF